jgi:uncharacterized protein (TIGR02246 family)
VTDDIRARIDAANAELMAALKRGDAAAIADAYTADAVIAPPHNDFVSGASAVRQLWDGFVAMGLRDLKLETAELEAHGDLAIEMGRYTLKAPEGLVLDRGKYLVVWKNERGRWKLRRDIWTTSQPAPKT